MERQREAEPEPTNGGTPVVDEEVAAILEKLRQPVPRAEIERRRRLYERVMKRRARMAPLGISTAELIRQAREEEEAEDGV